LADLKYSILLLSLYLFWNLTHEKRITCRYWSNSPWIIIKWYRYSPGWNKVNWNNELVELALPELNTESLSAFPGCPLVTVWGCPKSLLNQPTVVPVGTAIYGGLVIIYIFFLSCTRNYAYCIVASILMKTYCRFEQRFQ
jgi:hypothetical protein